MEKQREPVGGDTLDKRPFLLYTRTVFSGLHRSVTSRTLSFAGCGRAPIKLDYLAQVTAKPANTPKVDTPPQPGLGEKRDLRQISFPRTWCRICAVTFSDGPDESGIGARAEIW
jgi:hypothetical protein